MSGRPPSLHRKNAAEKVMAAAATALGKTASRMKEWHIILPAGFKDWTTLEKSAITAGKNLGLKPGPRQTLKTKPGSIHYHFTLPSQSGTLELTLWPKKEKLWLSVHANRAATWTDATAERLITAISKAAF